MNKFINIEKLKTEIERLTNQKKEQLKRFNDEDYSCSVASSINCELKGNEEMLSLIDSLQQKQLVTNDLGTLIACDIIEMTAKKAIDKPQDKEKEEELMTRKINYLISLEENYVQQEQPDVDLEKEAVKFVQSKEFIESKESPVLLTARHFYELGLKARKEGQI